MKIVKVLLIFVSLCTVIAGLVMLLAPTGSDDRFVGGILLAIGLTYLWYRTDFLGLK
jgi:hypothetical protein